MPGRSSPLFGSDSFLSDLSEAGLPRMTSTALRWTPKRHHFTRTNTRHTNKTPQTAQRYAVDPSFLVCLAPFPIKKTLKTALQFAFGRCKHPFAGKQMAQNAIILTPIPICSAFLFSNTSLYTYFHSDKQNSHSTVCIHMR